MIFANEIKGYEGHNPFCDSQARNFSDKKLYDEFYPTSNYWTMFNDQHEILLGTRGSGKTFLLKMMRYSMLKKINDPRAEQLANEKNYIAVYVPMHLEFVVPFNNTNLKSSKRVEMFQIAFNCFLGQALLIELKAITDEISDDKKQIITQVKLLNSLYRMWFGRNDDINTFEDLSFKIKQLYYNIDWEKMENTNIPPVFKRYICTPLIAAQDIINNILELRDKPTWIVCIDEAEFLNIDLQKCINSVFRSDSNRIALKVATLPFYHATKETLDKGIMVSNGNDFSYRNVDMQSMDQDFIGLTNKLCKHRLRGQFVSQKVCETLEDFVGIVGNDDLIDYYRNEVGEKNAQQEDIQQKIMDSFAPKRKENAPKYKDLRKTVYDKYAPIFFVREMYKKSRSGNSKPGWYAGAKVIRKVSQGNPRLFIQIMNEIFEYCRMNKLTAKAQNTILYSFSKNICESTKALELQGPVAFKNLDNIATTIHKKIHDNYLTTGGLAFSLKYKDIEEFKSNMQWIQLAIAYSRILVDDEVKKNGLTMDTKYSLSNAYAVTYWIPMRTDSPINIVLNKNSNSYKINEGENKQAFRQLSFFDEEDKI